jgi:hypothetical protein
MSSPDPRIEALFHDALALPPTAREAFILTAVKRDSDAFRILSQLLAAHGAAGSYFEQPLPPTIEATLARLKPEEPGEMIGPYRLREQIGEGGFGTVWVADQEWPVGRRVALKIIKLGMGTKEVIARFEQERQTLAMMEHPNIAKVFDAGATQYGRPFFVMELVRGVKITEYCDDQQLSTKERIELSSPSARRAARASERDHPPGPEAVEHPRDGERREGGAEGDRLRRGQGDAGAAD